MSTNYTEEQQLRDLLASTQADEVAYHFEPTRRDFMQVLGAGILVAAVVATLPRDARAGGRGGGQGPLEGGIAGTAPNNLLARLHIGRDGGITLLCGKVECGQGVRSEVALAAAEELRVRPEAVSVILADTALVPNDGPTVGSQSTPRTIPPVRQAAAAARQVLVTLAATVLQAPAGELSVADGRILHAGSGRSKTYAELASTQDLEKVLAQSPVPRGVAVTAVAEWKVLGKPYLRSNARDIVTGKLAYPSDVVRPGMLYGRVLRAPAYNNSAASVDLSKARAMPGVVAVQDGTFIGVAAPTLQQAGKALEAIEVRWQSTPHPASADMPEYLVQHANVPANRFAAQLQAAAKVVKASYYVPFIQHAPMEPRAAVAEWNEGKLTVWTGTQQPFGVRNSLAQAFNVGEQNVRVIAGEFGGGFGGKHTGECAIEAARLARAAGKPVWLRYTRQEEFMWAYFRPAGVMQCEASLDAGGKITSWHFVNIHSGPAAVQTPYAIASNSCQSVNLAQGTAPLRVGSYRGLAATANAFARECFMDELAAAAGQDPLEFRRAHLTDARLRAVLDAVAERFGWAKAAQRKDAGVGIACAVEKGGYVAAAAEVAVDREAGTFKIVRISHVFECGKILNPPYLMAQIQGAVIQGLGPILREEMAFENGRLLNRTFAEYKVPRFSDVPALDLYQLDRPDLDPAGAGETPLIAVAPAVANALSRALGARVRELPLKMPA